MSGIVILAAPMNKRIEWKIQVGQETAEHADQWRTDQKSSPGLACSTAKNLVVPPIDAMEKRGIGADRIRAAAVQNAWALVGRRYQKSYQITDRWQPPRNHRGINMLQCRKENVDTGNYDIRILLTFGRGLKGPQCRKPVQVKS
jgi:hypothetical protein